MHAGTVRNPRLVRGKKTLRTMLLPPVCATLVVATLSVPAVAVPGSKPSSYLSTSSSALSAEALSLTALPAGTTSRAGAHTRATVRAEREWILLTYDQLTVRQTSAKKVKSTGTIAMIMKKRGTSIKATVSINPAGAVAKTGKSKKQTVTLKWSKKYQEYRGKFSLTTGGVGPVVVQARADKRIFTTTRRPSHEISTINGMGSGRTAIGKGSKAVANVTVTPAFGRKIFVEKWVNGQWQRTQTLTASTKKRTDTVRIELPAPSNNTTIDAYRVYSPATNQASKTRALRHNIILKQP